KRKENVVNNSLVGNVNYLPCCTIGTIDQGDQMLRRKMIIVIQLMPRALRSSGDTQVVQKRSAVQYCCISNFPLCQRINSLGCSARQRLPRPVGSYDSNRSKILQKLPGILF